MQYQPLSVIIPTTTGATTVPPLRLNPRWTTSLPIQTTIVTILLLDTALPPIASPPPLPPSQSNPYSPPSTYAYTATPSPSLPSSLGMILGISLGAVVLGGGIGVWVWWVRKRRRGYGALEKEGEFF